MLLVQVLRIVNITLDIFHSSADNKYVPITGDSKMARISLMAALVLCSGCRTYQSFSEPKNAKWGLESGVATSVYPNAPCDKHEYLVEKIDVSIKLRREW
jgi:hypothetical protein